MNSQKPSETSSQDKAFQWGLGLILLGLVGLILPTFGLELRRLQRLGEFQWVVLVVMVTAGCIAVFWSRRQQLAQAAMITGGALTVMLLFGYLSFWRHAIGGPVAPVGPIAQQGPAQQAPPVQEAPPVQQAPVMQDAPLVQEPPAIQTPAVVEQSPAVQETPATQPDPVVPDVARGSPNINPPAETKSKLIAGGESGKRFTDNAPAGGLLVGLRCSKGKNWGGALQAVQPIYQVGTDYVLGQRHGTPGGDEEQLLAKPGYAVGAIHARAGLVLNAVQLVFYRIQGERLDPADQYETLWVGSEGGGSYDLDAKGAPVTEVFGTWEADLISIGLDRVDSLSAPIPLASSPPPELPRKVEQNIGPSPDIRSPPPATTTAQVSAKAGAMLAGRATGKPFEDESPAGGLLVGLRCAKGKNWGGAVQAVQPIYQDAEGYVFGQRHGTAGGDEQQLLAKPGYAVGAIHARAGLVLNAVRLSFYRIKGQRLDPKDHYETPWVGSDGGGPFNLDAKGRPIGGIFGTWVEDIVSIGCAPGGKIALAARSPKTDTPAPSAPDDFRQWISSDGKSKVEAKMLGKTAEGVRLERRDGKVIDVPLSRLSIADADFVRSQQ